MQPMSYSSSSESIAEKEAQAFTNGAPFGRSPQATRRREAQQARSARAETGLRLRLQRRGGGHEHSWEQNGPPHVGLQRTRERKQRTDTFSLVNDPVIMRKTQRPGHRRIGRVSTCT